MRLQEPERAGQEIIFRWEVTPASEFYERCDFRLSFPDGLDLDAVPRALWWRIALLALYTHWAYMRPCRVELPIRLGEREREFWMRLIDNTARQLETYGSRRRRGRAAQLVERGPMLEPVPVAGAGDRAAVSFSGGKDSLVLAALLSELTERPLLVMTTSPVPWTRDNSGDARKRALAEVARLLPVDTAEVHSDLRTCWNPHFAACDGGTLAVNLVSDIPLFQAVTLAAGAAGGAPRAFIASEADCQYNAEIGGRIVQHQEFVGTAAVQGALDELFSRFGLRQGSLTYPIHMPAVQSLIWQRYRDLASVQFSCYQAPEGARACNECPKCLQITLVTLAEGISPLEVGIDPVAVLCARADWPLDAASTVVKRPRLHERRSSRDHVVRCLQSTSTDAVAAILAQGSSSEQRLTEALAVYGRLRSDAMTFTLPPAPGYVPGLLDMVHADLRVGLRAILEQHLPSDRSEDFDGMVARANALREWITEPLQGQGRWRRRS